MFECRICGKRWTDPHFESEGTFYTLCPPCGAKVLVDLESGITAMEIKALREKKEKMIAKNTSENVARDWWFLRDNGVHTRTVMRMLGMAYQEKEVRKGT